MRLIDIVKLAAVNLKGNPLRTGLCMLSVAVGTSALLVITSAGLFGQAKVDESLRTIGVSGLTVYLDERGTGTRLSAEVADKMEDAISGISTLMPIKAKTGSIRAGHSEANAVFLGADGRMGEVMQFEILYGSLLTDRIGMAEPVVVVGDDLAKELYGRENIAGRQVRLRIEGVDKYFTVCGVVKAQTGAFGGAVSGLAPHLVYVPYQCVATMDDNADQVFVQCAAGSEPFVVGGQIESYLSGRVKVDGTVRVQNMSGMVDTVRHLADICALLFAAAGGVTLCVALAGLMCSMISATYEKTGEIGVFLALGAQRRDIRRLFLLQSVMLCAGGGVCGLTLAGLLLYFGASLLLPGWKLTVAVMALCVICGALSGLLPAVRASRLDPINAINQ